MVKAANALQEDGHTVRLVSAQFLDWAADADRAIEKAEGISWSTVDYRRDQSRAKYVATGLRHHAAHKWVHLVGVGRSSLAALAAANGRASHELLKIALAEPADLFYGGASGGLAVAALASRRAGAPYGLDLEDFHEGQSGSGDACREVLRRVLPAAAFLTAGSAGIAAQYQQEYGVPVMPIHNTFPLPPHPPDPEPRGLGILRLYWFSQTVGAGRGLEDVVRAVGLAGIRAELHLRGLAQEEYIRGLHNLAWETSERLTIHLHQPAPPNRMVELCLPYDAGLSPEQGEHLNPQLCLGNKALTYILAGLAVVLTDTPGQRTFAGDLGEGALRYKPGDIPALAGGLRRWAEDRGCLRRARQAAWQAARLRWHWEDRRERGALLHVGERSLPVNLRIAITADPYLPVPPRLYGGIERVIDFLARGLMARGHQVTLFAHPESQAPAALAPYGSPPHFGKLDRARELWQVGATLWTRRNDFHLVHSFGRLAALGPVLPVRGLPKIQSYQRDGIPWKSVRTASRLARNSICFTACSTNMYRALPARGSFGNWHTVFNGVDLAKFTYQAEVAEDAPLVFLGRLEPIKGAHHAIAIATAAGRRLVIAGNRVSAARDYFESEIAPHIDGDRVQYIGEVDDDAKNRLLSGRCCLADAHRMGGTVWDRDV